MGRSIVPKCVVFRKEQEIQTSGIKETSLNELAEPLFREQLVDINSAYREFCRADDENNYVRLTMEVFRAAGGHTDVFVPFRNGEYCRTVPEKVNTNMGQCYAVCTMPEEAALCPDKFGIMFALYDVILLARNDAYANGICINPYGEHPCMIPRRYLQIVKVIRNPE